MKFEYSFHWKKQKKYLPEITDDLLELCIMNSRKIKDRVWSDAYDAIAKIPPSGRVLKAIYKDKGALHKQVILHNNTNNLHNKLYRAAQ